MNPAEHVRRCWPQCWGTLIKGVAVPIPENMVDKIALSLKNPEAYNRLQEKNRIRMRLKYQKGKNK